MFTGPEISITSAPGCGRRRRDRMALLAGGAVGDVAHRIDRLMGRARGHQHALAGERASAAGPARLPSSASAAATISSGSAMRPMPASPRSAISPSPGPTTDDAVGREPREIAPRRRMAPHPRIHGGRDQHRRRRSRAAPRWRGRRHGRPPSWPSGRRSRAPPRPDRRRAPAGYGRHRTRSPDRTGR